MPRYHFHTDSHHRFTDHDGEELGGLAEARTAAAKATAELLLNDAPVFWSTRPWTMTVTDASGLILFTVEVHGQNSPSTNIS